MGSNQQTVAEQWRETLKVDGYSQPPLTRQRYLQLHRLSRTWRKLFDVIGVSPGFTFFEFGCGGGQQLVPLALRGHATVGIDASPEVLQRCRSFISDVERHAGRSLPIQLELGDFLDYRKTREFDVVFNFGAIEHFLDAAERERVLSKIVELTRPGGHVVSVVPNGMHPLRPRQRAEGLGGYHVPEIDYTDGFAREELLRVGLVNPQIIPWNLLGYVGMIPASSPTRLLYRTGYLAAQLLPLWPSRWTFQHAGSLLIIGQRPF